jgi:hypothetical protein
MLIYLDHAMKEIQVARAADGRPFTRTDLNAAIMLGAVERVRPKMMTVVAIMGGLIPILWSTGTGSEVMQRIAVPMIGGMISSTILTLIVIPAVYALVKGFRLPHEPSSAVPAGRINQKGATTSYFDRSHERNDGNARLFLSARMMKWTSGASRVAEEARHQPGRGRRIARPDRGAVHTAKRPGRHQRRRVARQELCVAETAAGVRARDPAVFRRSSI